jgi:hypothetical protein
VDDIVDAVHRGRLSSALAGVAAFLRSRDARDLDAERRAAFDSAREEAGLWGLAESERLAKAGDADAAGVLLAKALAALEGTPREAEAEAAATRVKKLLEGIHAADAAKARGEALVPAEKAMDLARAKSAKGDPEGGLADLLLVLKTTTNPDVRAEIEKEVAALSKRVKSKQDRQGLRKKADDLISKGQYDRAREILKGLVEGAEAAGAGEEEAAKDKAKLEGVDELEENKEPDTLAACRRALRWLQKQQLSDGSFSPTPPQVDAAGKPLPEDNRKKAPNRIGLTGLASLALLGHVRYDLTDEFAPALQKSLEWLQAAQKPDGAFGGTLYEQAIATLALVEADRYFRIVKLKPQAVAGLVWIQKAQNDDGGWRYSPRTNPSDVSVTCWALQSLLHARSANYEVTDDEENEALSLGKELRPRIQTSLERAFAYLDRMTDPVTKKVGYTNPGQGSSAMTAAALFCRLRYDQGPDDDRVRLAADSVVKDAVGYGKNNAYGLFYASDGMSKLGGTYWQKWAPALKKYLLESQVKEGDAAGSWPNAGDSQGKNENVGAVFVVSMNALSLENFFEHRE